jgi:hypothetical protein
LCPKEYEVAAVNQMGMPDFQHTIKRLLAIVPNTTRSGKELSAEGDNAAGTKNRRNEPRQRYVSGTRDWLIIGIIIVGYRGSLVRGIGKQRI